MGPMAPAFLPRYISEDEVVDAFKKLHLPEKYAKKFMEEADIDHDGKITKEEFILYAKHKEESIYTAFAKMDKDGDGTLDKEEIGELLESLHLHPSESDKEKILHVFTKNEKISYAEFRDVFILLDPADLGELTDEMQELFTLMGSRQMAAGESQLPLREQEELAAGWSAFAVTQ